MHPDWIRSIRDECQRAGVAFLFKQHGEFVPEYVEGRSNVVIAPSGHVAQSIEEYGEMVAATASGRERNAIVTKVGKKAAGRLLDGRTWDEYPEPLGK